MYLNRNFMVSLVTASLLMLGGVSPTRAGPHDAQIARFKSKIQYFDDLMKSSTDVDEIIDTIVNRGVRVPAFNLEGIARVYRDRYPFFVELHDSIEKIENFVGKVDQWEKELAKAKQAKDDKRIKNAKEKLKSRRKKFKEFLTRKGPEQDAEVVFDADQYPFVRTSDRWRKTDYYLWALENQVEWSSYAQDRDFSLAYEQDQIWTLWNEFWAEGFDNLELENGIHHLRKQARWVMIEMRASNGLYVFRDNPEQCDIPAYKELYRNKSLAESKYAKLTFNPEEPKPCAIQQCVFLGLTQMQNRVADIKDELEKIVDEKDRYEPKNVPKEYRKKMEKIYGDFLENQTWETLIDQIQNCRDS